tara:strand:- start:244 stop:1002 length:759 start_codon:yes stop_codon:yes gene_type:complete
MAHHIIKAVHSNTRVGTFLTFIFLQSLLGALSNVFAQEEFFLKDYTREYVEQDELNRYESLMAQFGNNKKLPVGFELQTLLALSHFPQLRDTKINFIVDDVSIPLSSRPLWSSLHRSAKNRTYQVIIDNELVGSREALLLKNQPFNAQVGIIGHELAHTAYYLDRSFFGILGDALCQLSDCRINFERATDRRLIDHGLGWQRFDHARFVRGRMTLNLATAFTAQGGGGAYMSPAEISQILQNHEAYSERPVN